VEGHFQQVCDACSIDPVWLTAMLHSAGIGVGNAVVEVSRGSIGTGQLGDNVRFQLRWRDGAGTGPASVIGKFPSKSDASRAAAIAMDTYVKEVGFYRDLKDHVSIRTPASMHVGWNDQTHDFVLMMEDITPAQQGDQIDGCGVEQAALVVDQAVGLHGPTWGRAEELAKLAGGVRSILTGRLRRHARRSTRLTMLSW